MKVVIAPDSFKESMSASLVAEKVALGIRQVLPKCEIVEVPIADGGEGTVEALITTLGGEIMHHDVTGPLGEQITAHFGVTKADVVIIEIAAICGLHLLAPSKRNPFKTTTFGVGELITHVLDLGYRKFIIGLGGSSTNDGGIGMLQALGMGMVDKQGNAVSYGCRGLAELANLDLSHFDRRLVDCQFTIASDVRNLLLGDEGATTIFGPQKGLKDADLPLVERAMSSYNDLLKKFVNKDIAKMAGSGAAGGLGAAFLAFFNVSLHSGFDVIANVANLEEEIKTADILITGEGKIDNQSIYGKVPIGVAALGKKHDVPVIVITGANNVSSKEIYQAGVTAIFPIVNQPMSLNTSLQDAEQLIVTVVENIFRLLANESGFSHKHS